MARFVVNEIFFSPGYPRVSFVRTSHDARPGCSVLVSSIENNPGIDTLKACRPCGSEGDFARRVKVSQYMIVTHSIQ